MEKAFFETYLMYNIIQKYFDEIYTIRKNNLKRLCRYRTLLN